MLARCIAATAAALQCFSIKEEPTALFINQPVNTIEFNDGGIDYRNVLTLIADLELSGISIDTITFPSAKVPRHTIAAGERKTSTDPILVRVFCIGQKSQD